MDTGGRLQVCRSLWGEEHRESTLGHGLPHQALRVLHVSLPRGGGTSMVRMGRPGWADAGSDVFMGVCKAKAKCDPFVKGDIREGLPPWEARRACCL